MSPRKCHFAPRRDHRPGARPEVARRRSGRSRPSALERACGIKIYPDGFFIRPPATRADNLIPAVPKLGAGSESSSRLTRGMFRGAEGGEFAEQVS